MKNEYKKIKHQVRFNNLQVHKLYLLFQYLHPEHVYVVLSIFFASSGTCPLLYMQITKFFFIFSLAHLFCMISWIQI